MRRCVAGALVLALALSGAACGDDSADESTTTTGDGATTTEAAGGDVLVTATDYDYEGLPATIGTGDRLQLVNDSAVEVHELVAVLLPDDEERSAGELFSLPEAELGALIGGEPAVVLVAPPSSQGFPAVGDGTLSEPGRYVVGCFIPTGADPAEYLAAAQAAAAQGGGPPQVEGGPPHFTQGMYGELEVE